MSLIYRLFCEQEYVCRAICNEFCSWLHIWLRSAPLPHSCAVCRFVSHLICRLVFMKYQPDTTGSQLIFHMDRVRLGLILLIPNFQANYGYIPLMDHLWELFLFWNWDFVAVIHCLDSYMMCWWPSTGSGIRPLPEPVMITHCDLQD